MTSFWKEMYKESSTIKIFWSYMHKNAHRSWKCKLFIWAGLMNKQKDFLQRPHVSRLSYSCCEVHWFLYKRIWFQVRYFKYEEDICDAGFSLFLGWQFLQLVCTVVRRWWGRKHKKSKVVLILHISKMVIFLISSKECLEKCAQGTSLCMARKGFSTSWAHSPCSRYAYGVFTMPFTCQTVFDLSFPPQGL